MQFWRVSVLQRHCVLPPGGDFFHGVFPSEDQQQQQQKFLQQQAEKVARIHSSSKRGKKAAKSIISSSCSMGFRSYVRHFRGAILGASPSFRGMVFCCNPTVSFFRGSAAGAAALKFGSAGSTRVACLTSVPERLEL